MAPDYLSSCQYRLPDINDFYMPWGGRDPHPKAFPRKSVIHGDVYRVGVIAGGDRLTPIHNSANHMRLIQTVASV